MNFFAGSKRARRTWVLAVALAWLAVSCAGLGKRLEPPDIMLADIAGGTSSGMETVFEVALRVFNTNEVPLEVRSVDCELEVNGKTFARGISNVEITIPEFGTEIVPVTVYSSVLNILYSALSMANEAQSAGGIEKLSYRMKGKLRLKSGDVFPATIPFDVSGELDLKKLTEPKSFDSKSELNPS